MILFQNKTKTKSRAQATLEYMALAMFMFAAFIVFQKYIARGFYGRWKSAGDQLGGGIIYDPKRTTECIYDNKYYYDWYSKQCFEANGCDCLSVDADDDSCKLCIQSCIIEPCKS